MSLQERVNFSLTLGWIISTGMLVPPKHFECKNYAATWEPHVLLQGVVCIPHFFYDDHVMKTGAWKKD